MSDTIQQTVPIPVQVRTSTAFRSSECPLRGQEQVIGRSAPRALADTLQTVDGGCHRLGFGSAEPTSEAKAGVGDHGSGDRGDSLKGRTPIGEAVWGH